jgi:hypothetical protein
MRARYTAAAFGALLGLASASRLARADVTVEACSSAYTKGQEERLAGRLFSAREAFEICADPSCPAVIVGDCRHWITEVEADLPTVRIHVTDAQGTAPPELHVFADGVGIPLADLAQPVILEAGPHLLRFEAAGYQPVELEKALRPADRELDVGVVMQPLNAAPPSAADSGAAQGAHAAASHPVPVLAVALASVGVVALAGSLYFGLSSHSRYEDLKSSCAPACNPSQADSVRSKALVSDVALLTGVAALGAAAWVYFSAAPARPPVALNVEPNAHGAALRFRVAF